LFLKDDSELSIRLRGVASTGLEDVSKDGCLAVDRLLQVFDVASGLVVSRFWPLGGAAVETADQSEVTFARLTFDGRYVVWAQAMMVVVGRVSDGFTVASVSAHERVTSLTTTDFGYRRTHALSFLARDVMNKFIRQNRQSDREENTDKYSKYTNTRQPLAKNILPKIVIHCLYNNIQW